MQAGRELVQEFLDDGIVRPITSEWGAPALLVPKPKGGWRLVVDLRELAEGAGRDEAPRAAGTTWNAFGGAAGSRAAADDTGGGRRLCCGVTTKRDVVCVARESCSLRGRAG